MRRNSSRCVCRCDCLRSFCACPPQRTPLVHCCNVLCHLAFVFFVESLRTPPPTPLTCIVAGSGKSLALNYALRALKKQFVAKGQSFGEVYLNGFLQNDDTLAMRCARVLCNSLRFTVTVCWSLLICLSPCYVWLLPC